MKKILQGLQDISNSYFAIQELQSRLKSRLTEKELYGDERVGPGTCHRNSLTESREVLSFIEKMQLRTWARAGMSEIIYCRALCGDERIIPICEASFTDKSQGGQTMSLCALGTAEAIEALRKVVRGTDNHKLALAAAYSLAWHHVDDGVDVMLRELRNTASDQTLFPSLFLAMCHHRGSCDLLVNALSNGLGPSWPVDRILLAAQMNVTRARPTGRLRREAMLHWISRMRR